MSEQTTAKALIQFDANTLDAVREINKLAEAQRKLGEHVEKGSTGFSKFMDGVTTGLTKLNFAAQGVQTVFAGIGAALDIAAASARENSMEKLLPAGAVDRFREATDKLIGRQETLRLSVKGMTGAFAISNSQMETVLKTAVALQERGFGPAAQVADKLIESLGEKSVDKLDDFGIALTKTADKAADNNRAFAEFEKIISGTGISEETKNVARLSAALDEFSHAMKSMVSVSVQGFVALGDAIGRAAAFVLAEERDESVFMSAKDNADYLARIQEAASSRQARLTAGHQSNADSIKDWVGSYYTSDADKKALGGRFDTLELEQLEEDNRRKERGKKRGKKKEDVLWVPPEQRQRGTEYAPDSVGSLASAAGRATETLFGFNAALGSAGALLRGMASGGAALTAEDRAKINGQMGGLGQLTGQGESFMGGAKGKALWSKGSVAVDPWAVAPDEEQTWYGGGIGAGVAGAMAGIDAMINGQEAVGKSIAKASATALKAKALEWGAFAIGEAAWGIADAARLLPTAAGHFAAAAKFGAAAAAAGLGAAALGSMAGGGGGGSSGAGSAAGGGYASPGGSGRGGSSGSGHTVIVNIGGGFADPKAIGAEVSKALRKADLAGASRDNYATRASG